MRLWVQVGAPEVVVIDILFCGGGGFNSVVVIAVLNFKKRGCCYCNFLENVPLYERQLFCFSKKKFEKNTNLSTIET